jgi:hypothetical protein
VIGREQISTIPSYKKKLVNSFGAILASILDHKGAHRIAFIALLSVLHHALFPLFLPELLNPSLIEMHVK